MTREHSGGKKNGGKKEVPLTRCKKKKRLRRWEKEKKWEKVGKIVYLLTRSMAANSYAPASPSELFLRFSFSKQVLLRSACMQYTHTHTRVHTHKT